MLMEADSAALRLREMTATITSEEARLKSLEQEVAARLTRLEETRSSLEVANRDLALALAAVGAEQARLPTLKMETEKLDQVLAARSEAESALSAIRLEVQAEAARLTRLREEMTAQPVPAASAPLTQPVTSQP